MGERVDTFVEHAHLALPRFELYRLIPKNRTYGIHLTAVLVDDAGFPHVREPEETLARFLCLATVSTAVSDHGRPHRLDLRDTFGLASAVQGGANVIVTDQRLAGVVSTGDSLWGRLNDDRVLVFDLDLRDIDAVVLTVKSGITGTKERPVMVHSYLPMMGIRLEVIGVPQVGGGGRKEKSSRPLMEVLCASAAGAQLRSAARRSEERQLLHAVAEGEWAWDASSSEFVAELTSHDDLQLDESGARCDRPHWAGPGHRAQEE